MMRVARGFTIVEVVVVMVIMATLMVLGFALLTGSQRGARDAERQGDITALINGLESRYKAGNPVVTSPSYVASGTYPSIAEMQHIMGSTVTSFTPTSFTGGYSNDALPGTTIANFSPPGLTGNYTGFTLRCTDVASCAAVTVEDATQLDTQTTTDRYVYEPIAADGTICLAASCVRYNLYWRGEGSGLTTRQTERSRHQ